MALGLVKLESGVVGARGFIRGSRNSGNFSWTNFDESAREKRSSSCPEARGREFLKAFLLRNR
jgi:hypothetical protein